jgi:hypothetical protein
VLNKIWQSNLLRRLAYFINERLIRGHLEINAKSLEEVRVANRAFLRTIDCWIKEPDYQGAIFQYGLPSRVRHLIDAPMSEEVTYSDIITYLARERRETLRYLELGVSVGKNFAQVMNQVSDAELTCFDIEDINPVFEEMLVKHGQAEWPGAQNSIRKKTSRMTEYSFVRNRNKVRYLAGDVFDEEAWKRLHGQSYNLVFSDAFHSAPALLKEWEMLKSYDLLEPSGFIMIWDDLGGWEMRSAFYAIVDEMHRRRGLSKANAGIEFYRGWLGNHEPSHAIGFMCVTHRWR